VNQRTEGIAAIRFLPLLFQPFSGPADSVAEARRFTPRPIFMIIPSFFQSFSENAFGIFYRI
jgi:hypothetical protein